LLNGLRHHHHHHQHNRPSGGAGTLTYVNKCGYRGEFKVCLLLLFLPSTSSLTRLVVMSWCRG
jgi:hypothetical protein